MTIRDMEIKSIIDAVKVINQFSGVAAKYEHHITDETFPHRIHFKGYEHGKQVPALIVREFDTPRNALRFVNGLEQGITFGFVNGVTSSRFVEGFKHKPTFDKTPDQIEKENKRAEQRKRQEIFDKERQARRDKIRAINADIYNKNQTLKQVFKALRKGKEPLYARLNIANTDDKEQEMSDTYLAAGKGYKGYCYTIKLPLVDNRFTYSNYDIYIHFGSNHFETVSGGVGIFIIEELEKCGLKYEWDGSGYNTIKIPVLK